MNQSYVQKYTDNIVLIIFGVRFQLLNIHNNTNGLKYLIRRYYLLENASMVKQGKGQSKRLEIQQKLAGGPVGIFGDEAKKHDGLIRDAVEIVLQSSKEYFPKLNFRYRHEISKQEINDQLQRIDDNLGKVLFVKNAKIKPDGGIVEVKDKHDRYRVLLIGESKHQGNDIQKIKDGIKQGKNKDSDLMVAGNAIERVHKNILEFRNYMMEELYFPYVVFTQGSNFATETFFVRSPSGRDVKIAHDAGNMNRIDRMTASSFGMGINKNHCKNKSIELDGNIRMLQAASLYFKAYPWTVDEMVNILWGIIKTSFDVLSDDLEV